MKKNTYPIPFFRIIFLFFLTASIVFSFSCKVDIDENSYEKEMAQLSDYIRANGITVAPTTSGLYYIELKSGIGESAKSGDNVNVRYTGRLLNGTVFDSGTYGFVLGSNTVIKGWDEGISYMKISGTAQLIIPSTLGYGARGIGSIPPYSTLLFDVELLSIN